MGSLAKIPVTKARKAAEKCLAELNKALEERKAEIFPRYRKTWFGFGPDRTDEQIEDALSIEDRMYIYFTHGAQENRAEKILALCNHACGSTILIDNKDLAAIECWIE